MAITRKKKAGATVGGTLGGAGTGAAVGSIFGPLGTALGAGIGALAGGTGTYLATDETEQARKKRLKKEAEAAKKKSLTGKLVDQQGKPVSESWWSGRPSAMETFNQYTPEQQMALSQLLRQSLGNLGTEQAESAARKGFAEKTIPSIAERFTAMGAQRSSAFPQLLSQAGADLESSLAQMREERANRLIELGLRPQFESIYRPGTPGFGQELTSSLLRNLLTGENIAGGAKALKDALSGLKGSPYQSSGLPAIDGTQYQQNYLPSTFQKQTWNSNPGNLVAGTTIPGGVVPGIGNAPNLDPNNLPTDSYGAMKGLYGI